MNRIIVQTLTSLSLVTTLVAGPAFATGLGDKVTLNGFGGWAGGDTDGNNYLAGSDDREYDDTAFALAVTAKPSDRLTIAGQFEFEFEDEEYNTELDYAFAEWAFSDAVRVRGGAIKQPFGIYTEIFDVGTARPFHNLPLSVYGPAEIVSESFRGLSLTGFRPLSDAWDVAYDLYAGEIRVENLEGHNPLIAARFGEHGDEIEESEGIKDLLGGRVWFSHGSGLSFGLSAYRGTPEERVAAEDAFDPEASEQRATYGVSLQYLTGPWEFRAEWVERQDARDFPGGDGAYFEVARQLGEHWQLAARWEDASINLTEDDFPTFTEHEVLAATLNYWLSSHFVVRLAIHDVEGNLFAHREPDDGHIHDELFEVAEASNKDTRLIQLGLQFSF